MHSYCGAFVPAFLPSTSGALDRLPLSSTLTSRSATLQFLACKPCVLPAARFTETKCKSGTNRERVGLTGGTIGVDAIFTREHTDDVIVILGGEMALIARMATFWQCDVCSSEWFADSEAGPRQCPKCGSRKWNDGMVRDADLLLKSLVVRHLNPYRRPISIRQKAALQRIAANRRAEAVQKATQSPR
jgi:hypothetical protein